MVRQIPEEIIVRIHQYEQRKFRFYLDKGSRIEFALYAAIQIAENVLRDGDDGWEYCMVQSDIEELPASSMDGRFDLARLNCIHQGGGIAQERTSPFREVALYEGDSGGGYDDDNDEEDY